jgi:hypothetical protein
MLIFFELLNVIIVVFNLSFRFSELTAQLAFLGL